MKIGLKTIGVVGGIITLTAVALMTVGNNDAGFRTVVQYPTGTMMVKFSPGPYFKLFGSAEVYNDVITMDFDADTAESGATIDQPGVAVRYRDGGMGTIYGKARFNLPNDKETMLLIHRELRGNDGVAYKLIKSVSTEAINQTAGLMTSKEGYDTKRAVFTQWSRDQIVNGLYKTESKYITDTDEATGKTVMKEVPVIAKIDGMPNYNESDLKKYGITMGGFQLNNPTFEKGTLTQIAKERSAYMDIVTAKANAEKAKQETITIEEEGKAAVKKAEYAEKVIKERAVVAAERVKKVAEIKAEQQVAVATQATAQAEQEKLRQVELKAAAIAKGEGIAEANRLIIESDGALDKKLAAIVEINARYAEAMSAQKWVPEVVMGGSEGSVDGSSAVNNLLNMLQMKAAKEVAVDLSVK